MARMPNLTWTGPRAILRPTLINYSHRQVGSCRGDRSRDTSGQRAHQRLSDATRREHTRFAYLDDVVWLQHEVRLLVFLNRRYIHDNWFRVRSTCNLTIDLHLVQLRFFFNAAHHCERTTQRELVAKINTAWRHHRTGDVHRLC